MRLQAERNTRPEIELRRVLHARGMRFFVHRRPLAHLRRTADILFPRRHVAVFVHGCFWHGCPQHATWPRTNAVFWRAKIERNQARDGDTRRQLSDAGWRVIEAWEHETPTDIAERISQVVRGNGR
jgi:DNA mismatch endonuclease (patch repair protein)